jgi:hypothetical protein
MRVPALISPMSLGPTDPEEIIRFLLQDTPEPFPFARLIALLTFCVWMRWPDDDDVVLDAQTTAAAMVFLRERKPGNSPQIPLSFERLSQSIVHRAIYGQYWDAFEEQVGITDIVAFFMHCPEDRRPSLGKAYYFIDEGGFVSSDFTEEERKQMKRARSSLKAAWKAQARSSPLLWATQVFEDDPDLLWFAPDDVDYLEDAIAFVQSRDRLLAFFGVALFCQQKLARLLDQSVAAKIDFLTFPDVVTPVDPQLGTFDEDQMKILDKYAAPQ